MKKKCHEQRTSLFKTILCLQNTWDTGPYPKLCLNFNSVVRKPDFCLCENKGTDQLRSNQRLCFTTRIVQFLFFLSQALDDWTHFFFFFFCIFTRLETLTICSCNYFTFKTFSINPQSTLVYGLLYRQGRKRGVLVKLGSWDFPHLKLILHPLPLFQCWLSTHECLCKRSRPLPSFKISTTAYKN